MELDGLLSLACSIKPGLTELYLDLNGCDLIPDWSCRQEIQQYFTALGYDFRAYGRDGLNIQITDYRIKVIA